MPQFSTRRRVKHSAASMFDLVADIERYPEFVPLCRSMRVIRRAQLADSAVIVAEMTVAYKLIRESFTSRVTLDRVEQTILVEYLDGPFSRMENRWTFRPIDDRAGDDAGTAPRLLKGAPTRYSVPVPRCASDLGRRRGIVGVVGWAKRSAPTVCG